MGQPIGVFDSGVGGLSILIELYKEFKYDDFVYFGDIAHSPYGLKTRDEIYQCSKNIVEYLIKEHNVKAIIIACNTATVASIDQLVKEFDIPIIGVVDYAIEAALKATRNNKVGLLATNATINANYYQSVMHRNNIKLYSQACPEFVRIIEHGKINNNELNPYIKQYLTKMIEGEVDTIILGCTHFPLIKDNIKEYINDNINLIDPAHDLALSLVKEFASKEGQSSSIRFFSSTSDNLNYHNLIKLLFKKEYLVEYVAL